MPRESSEGAHLPPPGAMSTERHLHPRGRHHHRRDRQEADARFYVGGNEAACCARRRARARGSTWIALRSSASRLGTRVWSPAVPDWTCRDTRRSSSAQCPPRGALPVQRPERGSRIPTRPDPPDHASRRTRRARSDLRCRPGECLPDRARGHLALRLGRTKGYRMLRSDGFPRPIGGDRYRLDTLVAWENSQLTAARPANRCPVSRRASAFARVEVSSPRAQR